ncbi:hypothetical protein chiPu_0020193 [Chiloscyllium punctatum]|uniref:Ig-like domain-containing protein n=1 Tax=Chiloscyllium punctatum TaxID=137246 RepID=A0A401RU96_CHIPU|nr:hypothetical protein [Chiloscyllium punctatum]
MAANVSGNYACEAINTVYCLWKRSNSIHISIKQIAVSKPDPIILPGKALIEGDMGSLICSVSNGSLPIYYQF